MFDRLNRSIRAVADYFTEAPRNEKAATLLIKSLTLVMLFRLMRMWMLSDLFFATSPSGTPSSFLGKILLWPSLLSANGPLYFFVPSIAVCVAGLAFRPSYFTNFLLLSVALSFFRISYPVTNGADFVLVIFFGLALPLGASPTIRLPGVAIFQITAHNTFVILARIQLLTIYLISGWDKITSELWRSGAAFEYIANLDVMFNPVFTPLFDHPIAQVGMAWLTILFELLFIPLIWVSRLRLPMLFAGVVFHMIIWLMLGLPDFAWTMIATYPIFLHRDDFLQMERLFRKKETRLN